MKIKSHYFLKNYFSTQAKNYIFFNMASKKNSILDLIEESNPCNYLCLRFIVLYSIFYQKNSVHQTCQSFFDEIR